MPGDTVVPLIATRTGWNTSFGLTPSRSTTARSAASTRRGVEGLGGGQRVARGAQPVEPAVVHHLLPGLLVELLALDQEAGQRPEVGQRLELLLADRHGLGRHLAAQQVLEPRAQVLHRQLAQVAAVHPAQLLLVEHGRAARHAAQVEGLHELVGA